MKHNYLSLRAVLFVFLCGMNANAAITAADPTTGGITYQWTIQIGGNETLTTSNDANSHVGAWSWNDTDFVNMMGGGENMGWTHTTSWAALEVTETSTITIVMGANSQIAWGSSFRASEDLVPSFTIWKGWDSSADFGNNHTYENDGLISWSTDLTEMVGRLENSTESVGELTLVLEAGLYTIAFGSNFGDPGDEAAPGNQGYYATFTTTTIPEPSSLLLVSVASAITVIRRRRD
jgi:hypothetical protein